MTYTFKLARRLARFRGALLATSVLCVAACEAGETLGPVAVGEETATDQVADVTTDAAVSFQVAGSTARGITFGAFDLPEDRFGATLTGSVRAVGPDNILPILAAARAAGARVVVRLSRGPLYWTNADHSVNLAKWKGLVSRFKDVNIQPYIADGTLLAHYMIDEPHDPSNWGGEPVPFETIEAMAKFSKELWPGLTTVVRDFPDWLSKAPFEWKYLDAAWSQYSARKGDVNAWIKTQVAYAQQEGLGLIVGLNWLDGGTSASGIPGTRSGSYAMSASQLKTFGSALATNPYACAMYSWKYSPAYLGRSDIKAAVDAIAALARNRDWRSCQPAQVIPSINPSPIALKVTGRVQGPMQYMSLDWTGAKGSWVDVYRVGARTVTTENDGHYVNSRKYQDPITYTYKVCQKGTSICSKSVSVSFK
jgi:hypothetical protein